MDKWTPVPIVGGSYADDMLDWSAQDTVNLIPVIAEKQGTRSQAMLRGAPGMSVFTDLGTQAPIRGMRTVGTGLYAVSGRSLFRVAPDGTPTNLGTIPGVDRVIMSHNQYEGGSQIAIANGQSGYIYDTSANTLVQITDEGFPGAISFVYMDSYFLGIEPARRFAFNSDLADGTVYSTLDRYEAEGDPDLLVGQIINQREWWLMGEKTIEPYIDDPSGDGTAPFARASNTVINVGSASRYGAAATDNTVFWLGSDGNIYRASGYTPQRISTYAIEQAISRCNMALAFAFVYEDQGHKIIYWTFPDGMTWGYDVSTQEWHRRQSKRLSRWRLNDLVKWNGMWVGGDFSNGKLYTLDWAIQSEAGEPLERRRVSAVLHDNQNRVTVNALSIVVATGAKPKPSTGYVKLRVIGDLPDGKVGDVIDYGYTIIGGYAGYTAEISAGSLPPGVVMSPSGALSGVMVTGGIYSWTVKVTDSQGNTAVLADGATVYDLAAATLVDSRNYQISGYGGGGGTIVHQDINLDDGIDIYPLTMRMQFRNGYIDGVNLPYAPSQGMNQDGFGLSYVHLLDASNAPLFDIGWLGVAIQQTDLTPIAKANDLPDTIMEGTQTKYFKNPQPGMHGTSYLSSLGAVFPRQVGSSMVITGDGILASSVPIGSVVLDLPDVHGYIKGPDGTLYKAAWSVP